MALTQDPFAAPGNLKASGAKSKATLSWTDNSSVEGGFYVERAISGSSSFSRIATLGPNSRSYSDANLAKGSYNYRVQAFQNGAVTAYSNTATARVK